MMTQRKLLGGMGNLMFLKAFAISRVMTKEVEDAYVQDYRLWGDNLYTIRDYFRQGKADKYIHKTAVHIRRGDYLKAQDFHTNLWKTDYYKRAFDLTPGAKYLVFCMDRQSPNQDEEDREWCRKHLYPILGEDFELAPIHDDESQDMNLMAQCHQIIGANSSFSWWAAFISDADKIYFPEETKWFVDGKVRCKLLPEWNQVTV